ncbi:MAG: M23 family metallopeptidase [Deferrisomatales bacterium]
MAALLYVLLRSPIRETQASIPPDVEPTPPVAAQAPVPPEPPPVQRQVTRGVIRPGDTLWGLLGKYLTPQEIHALAEDSREVFPLSRICAGQPYEICTVEGSLEQFAYEIDREEKLVVRVAPEGFTVSKEPIPYEVRTDWVGGTIRTSLFDAVTEIGESPELALALADIFAWDVDFILDIREGDSFRALVEKRLREGKPAGYGRILAAEFVNQGTAYRAFWFQDGDRPAAYYDADGNSLRKAFLRAPLSFTRISSGFSRRRFHPITKTWKAHPAIDYAAPTGTPIKAVGDGVVVRKGYTRGNGNFIKLRHNAAYETLYLHMSRFAKGMRKGRKVAQGEVIGYVGSTGLATGPHLCFRMYRNGSPVNPLRVKSPAADPVSPANRAAFRARAAQLAAQLDSPEVRQARLESPAPEGGR